MKAIGGKCGWVISVKELNLRKLLRARKCERDREFVAKTPSAPRTIPVQFAREETSAFEARVLLRTVEALAA
jgi:hypothetical protein